MPLKRRALALEMGDLMAYEIAELLTNKLIAALMKEPRFGYHRVDVEQILEADYQAWIILEELTRGRVRRHGMGARPLDDVMDEVLKHDDFKEALAPRQKAVEVLGHRAQPQGTKRPLQMTAEQHQQETAREAKGSRNNSKKKKKAALAATRVQPPPSQGSQKAAGKGKARPAGSGPNLPPGLVGCIATSSPQTGSRRLCFGYNLGQCTLVADGLECPKGWHMCMEPLGSVACSQNHPKGRHA